MADRKVAISEGALGGRLSILASRLRWPSSWERIWHYLLSDEQRSTVLLIGGKRPDPIQLWANLHSVPPVEAVLDLSNKLGLLTPLDHQWLIADIRQLTNGAPTADSQISAKSRPSDGRKFASAELLGKHTHVTAGGTAVHVWTRDKKFIARGSFRSERFCQTLGETVEHADRELRHLLEQIERGTFVPPSKSKRLPLKESLVPQLTVDELANRFLGDVRSRKGKSTHDDYRSRLVPLIEFADRKEIKRKYAFANDVDRPFVIDFRAYLINRSTTRNGHPGSESSFTSSRQVFNVLDCCRTVFNWASRPQVKNLPPSFCNPFTGDLVGTRPRKDPVRDNPVPVEDRIALVRIMDAWELSHLSLAFVFSQRPDELAGLLVSDVNFNKRELNFGTRFGGGDFNKCKLDFRIPFPVELIPLLRHCIGGHSEGPLLRRRNIFEGQKMPRASVSSRQELEQLFQDYRRKAKTGEIQAEQDLKDLFRRMLRDLGGYSERIERQAFLRLLERAELQRRIRYDLRSATTSDMENAGIGRRALLYLTSHAVSKDIISDYAGIKPHEEMAKYFALIEPLLSAIRQRSNELGLTV